MEKHLQKKLHSGSHSMLKPMSFMPNHLVSRRQLLSSIQVSSTSLSPEKVHQNLSNPRMKLGLSSDSVPKTIKHTKSKLIISASNKSLEKLSPVKLKESISNPIQPLVTQRVVLPTIPCVVQSVFYKSQTGSIGSKQKKMNQDSFFVMQSFNSSKSQTLLGVQDGHGVYGAQVSAFVKSTLPVVLENKTWQMLKSDLDYPLLDDQVLRVKQAMIESYQLTNQELRSKSQIDISFSGTTAVSVLIRGRQLFCSNCGDSRAVLGRVTRAGWTAVALSKDHKPDLAEEKLRIEGCNGRVHSFRDSHGKALGPARVWLNNEDMPGLAMSRSIGDEVATRAGVICTPEVFSHRLDPNDKFLIIASDGVWEFISSEESVKIVSNYYFSGKFQEACEQLVSISTYRWNKEDGNVDDITVIIALLKVKDE